MNYQLGHWLLLGVFLTVSLFLSVGVPVPIRPVNAYLQVMFVDVVELNRFYHSRLGRAAQHSIGLALSSLWQTLPGERLLGLGYAAPFLDRFASDSERAMAFMPAGQGAVSWPVHGPSATALVEDHMLPLADSSVDRILMIHLLEHSHNPSETLHEAWRVLTPGGKLLIVVPNRRGIWARFEHTPFGSGRPYSKGQLSKLLKSAMLSPDHWLDALHYPPIKRDGWLRIHSGMERFGRRFWPVFSGVIIVEATKRLYQGLPVRERSAKRAFIPVLAPQATSRVSPDLNCEE